MTHADDEFYFVLTVETAEPLPEFPTTSINGKYRYRFINRTGQPTILDAAGRPYNLGAELGAGSLVRVSYTLSATGKSLLFDGVEVHDHVAGHNPVATATD
jgi:hypothetical protein